MGAPRIYRRLTNLYLGFKVGNMRKTTYNLAIANLVAQIGIIVTGGAVRLTGSGLGCSQWPLCEPGQFTPQFHEASSIHPYIEFGNRTLTGVLVLIAGLLLWAIYKDPATKDRPILKKLVWGVIASIAIQALVGGITVWVDLHPALVGWHMLLSLALVSLSAYIIWRMINPDTPPRHLIANTPTMSKIVAASAFIMVTLGVIVTGAGPHSGDENAPYRWGLDTVLVTRLHAGSVWIFVALVAATMFLVVQERLRETNATTDRAVKAWGWVLAVTVLEGIIGYSQHFLGLPEILVGLHMLGAALVVTSLTFAISSLHPRQSVQSRSMKTMAS